MPLLPHPLQLPEGAPQEPGTSVRAVVLDANKKDGIVDLSLQPRLLQAAAAAAAAAQKQQEQPKKKRQKKGAAAAVAEAQPAAQALQEGQQVEVTVELVSGAGWSGAGRQGDGARKCRVATCLSACVPVLHAV